MFSLRSSFEKKFNDIKNTNEAVQPYFVLDYIEQENNYFFAGDTGYKTWQLTQNLIAGQIRQLELGRASAE